MLDEVGQRESGRGELRPAERVSSELRRLPPSQRHATLLAYFQCADRATIARILHCDQAAVRTELHHAMHTLARRLGAGPIPG